MARLVRMCGERRVPRLRTMRRYWRSVRPVAAGDWGRSYPEHALVFDGVGYAVVWPA